MQQDLVAVLMVVGGRKALLVEFVGSREALHVVIVWIKSLCVVMSPEAQFGAVWGAGRASWSQFLVVLGGRRSLFVEFVGSRKALLIMIV
jgi:hypothetical protein